MTTVIEAVYENGVFKPLAVNGFKEHHHYRLFCEEAPSPEWLPESVRHDSALLAEVERRTTILPDGRRIIRIAGLFQADLSNVPDDQDPVAEALADMRRERARRFDERWPVLPTEET